MMPVREPQTVFCSAPNIYVWGNLFSCPCLCRGSLLESNFFDPPATTALLIIVVIVVVPPKQIATKGMHFLKGDYHYTTIFWALLLYHPPPNIFPTTFMFWVTFSPSDSPGATALLFIVIVVPALTNCYVGNAFPGRRLSLHNDLLCCADFVKESPTSNRKGFPHQQP